MSAKRHRWPRDWNVIHYQEHSCAACGLQRRRLNRDGRYGTSTWVWQYRRPDHGWKAWGESRHVPACAQDTPQPSPKRRVKELWEKSAENAHAAKRPTTRRKHANAAVEDFNERYPVGTPVTYWPLARGHEPVKHGETRSLAYEQHGNAKVMVTGHAGGMLLTHVAVRYGGAQ